jgi:hypothetical protein
VRRKSLKSANGLTAANLEISGGASQFGGLLSEKKKKVTKKVQINVPAKS